MLLYMNYRYVYGCLSILTTLFVREFILKQISYKLFTYCSDWTLRRVEKCWVFFVEILKLKLLELLYVNAIIIQIYIYEVNFVS